MGAFERVTLVLRNAIDMGLIVGPRIVTAGTPIKPFMAGDGVDISLRQRPEPTPRSAKCAAPAGDDLFNGRLAGKKGSRQDAQKGWIRHRRRRRNAPTSLTLREHVCVVAQ